MPSTVVRPGHVVADRYRIERWLGQGGMGSVYQAVQLSVQRTVALKRLVDEHLENPSHVERFEREALALSRLSHQSTVRLFDFGSDERGCPFIVMEYLQGRDLAADLELHGPMRWDHALAVCRQILGSLAEAHASGIVHRDIKPANLFLCSTSEWPLVKVLDFGIAGGAEPRSGLRKLTLTGTVLGSAPYMSPEQARGLPVGPAADLYSLGVVLFEMLTGRTPFEARTLTAQLIAKVLEAAPSLRDVCPDSEVPSDVQALVGCLLERDPRQRPPSARATAGRIDALLGRAALPPLSRAAQRPGASALTAKTELMLLPRTLDEGWTPPKTEAPSRSSRPQRAVVAGLMVAVVSAGAATWSWRMPPDALQPQAVLAVQPASSLDGSPRPDSINPVNSGAASDSADAGSATDEPPPAALALVQPPPPVALERLSQSRATPVPRTKSGPSPRPRQPARPRMEPTISSTQASSTSAPSLEPALPMTPETLVLPRERAAAETPEPDTAPPDTAPPRVERSEPAPDAPIVDPRYWTIGAARAAARSGDITPAQRNEIIAALRQGRLKARARAARAYREGRIDYAELLQRQDAIERRFEGW